MLGLSGEVAIEWNTYTTALRSVSISLKNEPDLLLWVGGDALGVLTVKNIYIALIHLLDFGIDNFWIQILWKWPVPIKIKLFIWLSAKEKVLT